jgi:hypothetical protein
VSTTHTLPPSTFESLSRSIVTSFFQGLSEDNNIKKTPDIQLPENKKYGYNGLKRIQ